MTLSAIGLFLAVVLFIVGTFKRVGVVPMSLIAALIVIVTSGIPLWTGVGEYYVNGFSGGYVSFFAIFVASCVYSKVMELSGSAQKIANTVMKWVGQKNVLTACCLTGGLLCYGGVNGVVLAFIMVPIMSKLFYEANIHRKYMMTVIMIANTHWCQWLPGSVNMSNVLPAQFFGTSLTAAPIMGLVASIILIVMQLWYINSAARKTREKGENFTFPPNMSAESYLEGEENLPSAPVAFLPFVVLIGLALFGDAFISNATALTTCAITMAALSCAIFNFKRLAAQDPKSFVTQAFATAIVSVGNIAAVNAMAAVFTHAPAYSALVNVVINADMNVYVKASLAASAGAIMAGSAMAGLKVVFASMGDFLLASGANFDVLARVMCITSLPMGSLPNCAGHYVNLGVIGLTQGDCYKDTFIVNVLMAGIVAVGCVAVAVLFY